ncbi:hypothetical protein HCCG_01196 [Helicobacter cinaedi CCUG 18818 = ATCC BAA-847]|uniref:Uncharacterized protein n=1 Tax=Helicobacter cinaedi CCUG 18818 = ATCC BAA-847 TaxID=537971 RepID=A0ABN0BAM3_9HELI|nr:hypothetical protein HCCG_01196 [Helicobacter cinaedi CCUG 18818 = ATCC BAA-847]
MHLFLAHAYRHIRGIIICRICPIRPGEVSNLTIHSSGFIFLALRIAILKCAVLFLKGMQAS